MVLPEGPPLGTAPPYEPARDPPEEKPAHWPWGPDGDAQKKLAPHLACFTRLLEFGLTGVGIAEAYHRCRVAPLMAWPLRL